MSQGAVPNTFAGVLHPDDLIEDRELASVDDDRLAHDGIVNQLVALVTTVPTPSNIALYGPWGSGKSGIANLLKARIDGSEGRRFVRFDAFKYADVPLRRNFISAIASELQCTEAKFHSDLYTGRTRTEIEIPAYQLFKLLGLFAVLMLSLTAIIGVAVATVAWMQNGDFVTQFRALSRQALLAGMLPAALLAALVSLASKTFNIDRSLAKPESDEQFEKLFKDLVEKSKAERLVIFVDELDRCSPDEVVATLDTVRTFLGLERCIFIIAADQNVLEEALTRRAMQATPSDEANPYYSTGSAYLDKVFQYQVALPPLLTQRVSSFAQSLVKGRQGVWAEIGTEYVLSVLVPTHVASPRRVKHLLNTFALTYRLAEQRHHSNLLSVHPRDCAAAIARLVCLRVEFPLFARHLEVDARLPDLVQRLIRVPALELPPGISERAEELARAYATGGAAPAIMLSPHEPADDTGEDREADSPDSDVAGVVGAQTRTIVAHNKQLLNYLSRTRQVRGPDRDLVYLQTTGTVFGLDGELALAVEQAAEDGDLTTLLQRIEDLEAADKAAVLDLLAEQIQTGGPLTGTNAAHSFLLLTGALPDLPVERVLDTVTVAISRLHDDGSLVLTEDSIARAWALVRAKPGSGAAYLRRQIVTAMFEPEAELPYDFLLDDAALAIAVDGRFVSFVVSELMSRAPTTEVQRLFRALDDDLVTVLSALRTELAARATERALLHDTWKTAQRPPSGTARSGTATPEPVDVTVLFRDLAAAAAGRETPVQHEVMRVLLAVDHVSARRAVEELIGRTEVIQAPELISAVLQALTRRTVASFPRWLQSVDLAGINSEHAEPLTRLLSKAIDPDLEAASVAAALTSLKPYIDALPEGLRPDLTESLVSDLAQAVATSDDAELRSRRIAVTHQLSERRLADADQIAAAVVATLATTLAQPLRVVSRDDPLYLYIVEDGADALHRAALSSADDSQLREILEEAASSSWLDTVTRVEVSMRLSAAATVVGKTPAALPTTAAIVGLVNNYGVAAAFSAALWVKLAAPSPHELALVLDQMLIEEALSDRFVDAAREVERRWSADDHRALLDQYLQDPSAEVPEDIMLQALGLTDAPDPEVADLLCGRFAAVTNNAQRHMVVTLWLKANVREDAARKRLLETVVFGLLKLHTEGKGNVGAVDLAFSALDKMGSPLPHGVKLALSEHIRTAVEGDDGLVDKAIPVLNRLGLKTKSKGLLRRKGRLELSE